MFANLPRRSATWLAFTLGATLAGAGVFAFVRRVVEAPRAFAAAPLWPRPDGSLPSRPGYESYGAVWDHGEELGADRASA